jgi:hypothetical protein
MESKWKKGDHVEIKHRGTSTSAVVLLASTNGRSMMLTFEGIVNGYIDAMPVLQDREGVYRDLHLNELVEITAAAVE